MTSSANDQWWQQWLQNWQALSGGQRPANPWAAALEQWSRSLAPPTPTYADVFERLMAQSRSFMGFGGAMGDAFESTAAPAEVRDLFLQSLEKLRQSLDGDFWRGSAEAAAGGLWQLPLQSWQRAASTMTGLPLELLHRAPGDSPTLSWAQQQLESALATPGLGYTREFQEQQQKLARLMIDYQNAFNDYALAYSEVGKRSIDRFGKQLKHREGAGEEPIASVKDLFNLWVDCSEQEYAEFVMGDDYVRLHGRLTNALMRLKSQEQEILDDRLEAMNLPTRRELDTLSRRFHEMRRSRRTLERELKTVRENQEEMRRQFATLQRKSKSRKKQKSK